MGALGSVRDTIKEKLSGGGGHESNVVGVQHGASGTGEGKRVVGVEEVSSTGATAEALRAADQMTGQAFNDVGRMQDEGVVVIERKDRQGKM